jgi:hypothetical protein
MRKFLPSTYPQLPKLIAKTLELGDMPLVRGQHADPSHPLAPLRARRERPRNCRAAEQRDEFAPLQLIELHSIPSRQHRFAGYRMGRDQSAGIGSLAKASPSSAGGHLRAGEQRGWALTGKRT